MRDVVLHVCTTCKREGDDPEAPRAGARLLEAVVALGAPVPVVGIECLCNCKRGCSIAVAGEGAWTYVFGDLDPALNAPDAVLAARAMQASADGLIPWRERTEILKRGMIARVPPFPTLKAAE